MARAEQVEPAAQARAFLWVELLVPAWRLLTSLRFALLLIGFLALAGLLSVVLPQVPVVMRGNPAAVDAWVEFQKGRFGPFTEPMYRLGLFSVFEARWFLGALAVLAVSVCAYVANRLPAAWRSVARPQERVPDAFFDRAAHRASFSTAEGAFGSDAPSQVEAVLRRRRFAVRSFRDGEAVYLFADRFGWAQLGGFASHIALVLFLAGGLVSQCGGYTNALFIAEGTTSPVFAVSHPDQMQVEVLDAVARFDESGLPVDYRSELVVYQGGEEVARGISTVNDPLAYEGYRFHQAGYFGEGAALRVRDAASGRALYREVLPLDELVPAPAITVRDAEGAVLLDDVIVPTEQLEGAWGTRISVPGVEREFWLGVRQDQAGEWRLAVFGLGGDEESLLIPAGGSAQAGDLAFSFVEVTGLPAAAAPSGSSPAIPGENERALVVMSETPEGEPYLTAQGPVDGYALTLYPDQPVRIGDQEYLFEGRREFAGIEVRRDPGANFIWVAAGVLLAGLVVTFYLPRLRLWARVRPKETVIAGLAEQSGRFRSEMRQLEREMGVRMVEREQEADA